MARIDGSDRMRLPPDSGMKPNAYSAREHSTSQPAKEAIGDWLQLLQQGRGKEAAGELTRAVEQALQQRRTEPSSTPRSLSLMVLTTEPSDNGIKAQVQLGGRVLTLVTGADLQPGQTLTVVPEGDRLRIVVPQSPEQKLDVLHNAQRAQLTLLATPTERTPLATLIPWLQTTPPATTADPGRSAENRAQAAPQVAEWIARVLPVVLRRWQQALPQAPPAGDPGLPTGSGTTTGPTRSAPADPTATTTQPPGTDPARSTPRLANHWIPQLIQATRESFGTVTPEGLRTTWQHWLQAARETVTRWPAPDLTGTRLTPVTADSSAAQPGTRSPATPLSPPANGIPSAWLKAVPLLGTTSTESTQAVPAPLRTAPATTGAEPRPAPALPADFWRLLAEQLIDQRLQQSGARSLIPSLQEQLHRRAELVNRQVSHTYSPAMLRQTLQNPATTQAATQATAEQQALLQVRQVLDQFSQQQAARILQTPITDTATETRPTQTAIPVMADDQAVWFDLYRWPDDAGGAPEDAPDGARSFTLDLHFHLTPMAPVCARITWQGAGYEITFLTRDMPTLRLLHHQLEPLDRRFRQLGLPVDDIQCRHGMPPRRQPGQPKDDGMVSDTHIDLRT